MRVFIGIDPRQPVAYNVLQWSIVRRAVRPVQIVPLVLKQLPIKRKGLTDFTFSRYLCPYLCGYQGLSVFMDADMLCLWPIDELQEIVTQERHPVWVVKGAQRFEWPSLMVFDNELCKTLTPEWIDDEANHPATLDWAGSVGELDARWNHCVGYDKPRSHAKVVHFTQGIPHFPETRDCEYSQEWWSEYESMTGNCSWLELMGASVHADAVLTKLNERATAWQSR